MALMEWSDDLRTGFRAIDNDHRMLVDILNALHEAVQAGDTAAECEDHLAALLRYVDEHFEREESFMAACGYPGIRDHMIAHQRMAGRIHRMVRAFRVDPASLGTEDVWTFLRNWLTQHILGHDMEYVPYLRGEMPGDHSVRPLRAVTVRVPEEHLDLLYRCADLIAREGNGLKALAIVLDKEE